MFDDDMFGGGIDTAEIDRAAEDRRPDPLPAGRYPAVLVEVEEKQKSSPTSNWRGLGLKWRIAAGDHANRYVFDDIRLQQSGGKWEVVQQMAREQIAAIGVATDVARIAKIDDLEHCKHKPVWLDVELNDAPNGRRYNNISHRGVTARNASATVGSGPTAPTTPPPGRLVPADADLHDEIPF